MPHSQGPPRRRRGSRPSLRASTAEVHKEAEARPFMQSFFAGDGRVLPRPQNESRSRIQTRGLLILLSICSGFRRGFRYFARADPSASEYSFRYLRAPISDQAGCARALGIVPDPGRRLLLRRRDPKAGRSSCIEDRVDLLGTDSATGPRHLPRTLPDQARRAGPPEPLRAPTPEGTRTSGHQDSHDRPPFRTQNFDRRRSDCGRSDVRGSQHAVPPAGRP